MDCLVGDTGSSVRHPCNQKSHRDRHAAVALI
jgi:hypothetical protein